MRTYITRVELHGAQYDDTAYATLHDGMERKGFARFIKQDGHIYHLPPGVYLYVEKAGSPTVQALMGNNADPRSITTKANDAVTLTGHTATILTCQFIGRVDGLGFEQAEPLETIRLDGHQSVFNDADRD
jgi:hypothetical protein